MPRYNEQILLEGAVRLEAQAFWILFWTAAKYTVGTFIVAGLAALLNPTTFLKELPVLTIAIAAAAPALIVGIFVGRERAFEIRLRAQQLLAFVQIEHNTQRSNLAR